VVRHAEAEQDPRERDREAREEDVERDVQPELRAGQKQGFFHEGAPEGL